MQGSTREGRLRGKTAVVTGGTTGIGFETARQYLEQGARIIITGQDRERLAAAAQELGPPAIAVQADVRRLRDLEALATQVKEEFSTLDVLFVNAGTGCFAPIESIDETLFDTQFAVNLKGVFFTVQKLLPLLHDGSSIILNASAVNEKGVPGGSIYFACKAAVRSLARTLAAELGPRGIRVNALSPGVVRTAFQGKLGAPKEAIEGFINMVTAAAPLGREGQPAEIAQAAVFLASDESSYMTASDLVVDGGYMNV